MDPPTYHESESWVAPPSDDTAHELPDYADLTRDTALRPRVRRTTAHVYNVYGNKGALDWFLMRVTSRARSAESLPYFLQGDPITGTVELNLKQETTVRAVTMSVRLPPVARCYV